LGEVMNVRDIGKNIRELRTRRRLSQDELAEKLFVTRQTISNYENGKSRPDVEMLMKIAEVLDTDMNSVLYGLTVPEAVKREKRLQMRRLLAGGTGFLLLLITLVILTPIGKYLRHNWYYQGVYFLTKLIMKPALFLLLGWILLQGAMMLLPAKPEFPRGRYVHWGILAVLGFLAIFNVPFAVYSLLPNEVVGNSFPLVYIPGYTELMWPIWEITDRHSYLFLLLGAAWRFFKPPVQKAEEMPDTEENAE